MEGQPTPNSFPFHLPMSLAASLRVREVVKEAFPPGQELEALLPWMPLRVLQELVLALPSS